MQAEVLCLLRDLAPQQARGVAKVRVGSSGDGGYVQLSDSDKIVGAFPAGFPATMSGMRKWPAWVCWSISTTGPSLRRQRSILC